MVECQTSEPSFVEESAIRQPGIGGKRRQQSIDLDGNPDEGA
jgi:hypothetical protein